MGFLEGDVPEPVPVPSGSAPIGAVTSKTIAHTTDRWYGRATLEKLSSGVWVMVYEETANHAENTDEVIHIRFSNDKGATWTAEDTYLDGSPVTGFPAYPTGAGPSDLYGPGDTYIFEAPNGDLWLHTWKVDYSKGTMQGTWHVKSTDGGATWGAWEQIEFVGQTTPENDYSGMTEQHFIIDGVIYMAGRVYGVTFSTVKMCFYKSEDNGVTWTWISNMSAYSDGTHECAMSYLGNNNILCFLRDVNNAKAWRVESSDFGATWGSLVQIQDTMGRLGRNRMYQHALLNGQSDWWTDQKLIMCGFIEVTAGLSMPRQLAVWTSIDGGATWQGPQNIDAQDQDGGYGDMLYNSDTDEYVVVTYKGIYEEADVNQYNFQVGWTI